MQISRSSTYPSSVHSKNPLESPQLFSASSFLQIKMKSCSSSSSKEDEEHSASNNSPPSNFLIFALPSTPFNFNHSTPFFRQPVCSNVVLDVKKSIVSNVDACMKMMDRIRSQNEVLDKLVVSFSSYFQRCCQIPRRNRQNLYMLSSQNFAAILPGDSMAGVAVANGISSFLNIYNTLLVARLVLTWFPNTPPAIVSPLSTLCDPYLNLFRGIIPPLGDTLDLSPILAFLVLNIFTSSASALPAELPPGEASKDILSSHLTTSQKKWMTRLSNEQHAKRSTGEI